MPEMHVGVAPDTIAIVPGTGTAHGKVFVANMSTNTVTVIDDTTNAVLATIPVGSTPVGIAASSQKPNQIYVANFNSNNVSVIDATQNSVMATLPVGTNPIYIADGGPAGIAVANFASNDYCQINPPDNTISAKRSALGTNPIAIVFSRAGAGSWAFLNFGSNNVFAGGIATPVGTYPVDIAAGLIVPGSPPGLPAPAYVANSGSHSVTVVDVANALVLATVEVGDHPVDIAVDLTANRIYVANFGSNTVTVIDGAKNAFLAEIPVGRSPLDIAVSPSKKKIYVANFGSNDVWIIDANTPSYNVLAQVSVGSNPFYLAVHPTTFNVYVANLLTNNVSVIDGTTDKLIATVPTGGGSVAIAPMTIAVDVVPVVPGGPTNRIYIGNTAIASSQ